MLKNSRDDGDGGQWALLRAGLCTGIVRSFLTATEGAISFSLLWLTPRVLALTLATRASHSTKLGALASGKECSSQTILQRQSEPGGIQGQLWPFFCSNESSLPYKCI